MLPPARDHAGDARGASIPFRHAPLARIVVRPTGSSGSPVAWDAALAPVRREFPGLPIETGPVPESPRTLVLSVDEWMDQAFDPFDVDDATGVPEQRAPHAIAVVAWSGRSTPGEVATVALQAATRFQRFAGLSNAASATPLFREVLRRHRALHDLALPLVGADYAHALDTWSWLLRIDPGADLALQAAALFHDVERLDSERERRVEQHARDLARFKTAHARGSARVVSAVLSDLFAPGDLDRCVRLVEAHEDPSPDRDAQRLADADVLSFFSLNASGFVRYHGPAHTSRKVAHALARMRPETLPRLLTIRFRNDFELLLLAGLAGGQRAGRGVGTP